MSRRQGPVQRLQRIFDVWKAERCPPDVRAELTVSLNPSANGSYLAHVTIHLSDWPTGYPTAFMSSDTDRTILGCLDSTARRIRARRERRLAAGLSN